MPRRRCDRGGHLGNGGTDAWVRGAARGVGYAFPSKRAAQTPN